MAEGLNEDCDLGICNIANPLTLMRSNHAMNQTQSLEALEGLIHWLDESTKGLALPTDRRSQIVSGCFDVALEHQAAIALLCRAELYGSMLALFRVVTESVVRGLWLLLCASDSELNRFEKGNIDKKYGTLVTEIETKLGGATKTLSLMKTAAWDAMNGFTHTGYIQVTRRYGDGYLGGNYPENDLVRCLNAVGALGLVASAQLVVMANRDDLVQAHIARMKEYASAP